MFGRDVPCVSLAHQYLITEPIAELTARDEKLPLLRDPDSSYYLRQEKDGLLLGPYEKNCRAHWLSSDDPMPDDFSFQLYNDDLERLEWYIEDACARVPILGTAGITRVDNGQQPSAVEQQARPLSPRAARCHATLRCRSALSTFRPSGFGCAAPRARATLDSRQS